MSVKISIEEVRTLAKLTNLQLNTQMDERMTESLYERIEAANKLSLKMSNLKYDNLAPITVFTYPENSHTQDKKHNES